MNVVSKKSKEDLMVSIKCLAYNHEKFIRETLEGFVMQKTNFRFEAIVHDDASTDKTAEIIREYAEKYPDIIKPIYETENQYSKQDGSLRRLVDKACKGKYIAFCEGDDYWTDPYKLQKQVNFLEEHPEYVLCSHLYKVYFQNEEKFACYDSPVDKVKGFSGLKFNLKFLVNGGWLAHPLTIMYRRDAYDASFFDKVIIVSDLVLFYSLLKKGYGYCMLDNMATYRIHNNGIWSGVDNEAQRLFEFERKLSIYNVDSSDDAAMYLLSQFTKNMRRIFIFKHWALFVRVGRILVRHFGFMYIVKVFIQRIFFNIPLKLNYPYELVK